MTPMPVDPWERQPGESAQAFAAFVAYRDQDAASRSLARVGLAAGKSTALLERWSARWDWGSRAAAHDAERDRQQCLARDKEIQEARQRHVALARAVLNKVLEQLDSLEPGGIPINMLDRLLKLGTDLELRSLREPTEKIEAEAHVYVDSKQALFDRIAAIAGREDADSGAPEPEP